MVEEPQVKQKQKRNRYWYTLPKSKKREAVLRLRSGEDAHDLAKEYKVHYHTIFRWNRVFKANLGSHAKDHLFHGLSREDRVYNLTICGNQEQIRNSLQTLTRMGIRVTGLFDRSIMGNGSIL